MERQFTDASGKSKMIIEGSDAPLNMPEGNVTLANRPKTKKTFGQDIGPGSSGFAGIATLAVIVALAGAIIAFLTLRY